MAFPQTRFSSFPSAWRLSPGYIILFLWGLAAIGIFTLVLTEFGFDDGSGKFYLLPWCFATGAVIAAPSIYLFYKGRFNPFHPLVFAAWSYFFPGFFIGGLVLAVGLSQPYFLAYVQDENYNLPLTFGYIMLGFAGLTLGFAIPYARRFGEWLGKKLPDWEMRSEQVVFPAILLLILGVANTIIGFAGGILGFQRAEEINSYDGLIFLLSLLWLQGSFLLWLYIFRSKTFGLHHVLIIGAMLLTSLTRTAFQGNRGGLLALIIDISFAYVLSRRALTAKHYVVGSCLLIVGLIVGMIYGTTFRSVKQTQEQMSLEEYSTVISSTLDKVAAQDPSVVFETGMYALAERIDAVSPLAVVVSNYEVLAPYEESWGINNNIYVDTVTFFIPRVIWPEKPVSIEPRAYADLYFNFSENSFTMTPMGDLLRNFGPFGVPLGMIILGFMIRILYSSLIEQQEFRYWRAVLFFMVFSHISYEGTYGLILPTIFKVSVIALFGLIIVRFFAGVTRKAS